MDLKLQILLRLEDLNLSNVVFDFHCVYEESPGEKWLAHWNQVWPHCKRWYLSEGLLRRPGYQTCLSALRSFMPEIEPVFMDLLSKTEDTDIAGRFLSLYNPPPYLAGCSEAIWKKEDLFLIRNYDYGPEVFERTLLYSNWMKPVIGMLDCAWGLLDGMNADGLVASLTFGGKKEVGEGFGAPLILRYLLETSSNVDEARIRIAQIPCHMAYNVMLLDKSGHHVKVYLRPGSEAVFIENDPVSTNHQERIEWLEYAEFSRTIQRYNLLKKKLLEKGLQKEQFIQCFFEEPLFNTNFKNQFGTLYNCIYKPQEAEMSLLWQNTSINQSFKNFTESKTLISIEDIK